MDGIRMNVKARVTVRANLERLIGGATEAVQKAMDAIRADITTLDVDAIAMGHGQPVASGAGALLAGLAAEL